MDLTTIIGVLKIIAALVAVYAAARLGEPVVWVQTFSERHKNK